MKKISFGLLILWMAVSCQKPLRDVNDYFPKINTISATQLEDGTVLLEAELESEGAAALEYAGFCASTSSEPGLPDRQQFAEYADGRFYAIYSGGFDFDSVYYFRSWAANGFGYSYGNIVSLDSIIAFDVAPPCALGANTVNLGAGLGTEAFHSVGDPVNTLSTWQFTAVSFSGPTVEFTFGPELTTGIYTTVGHNSPGPEQVFVSFYSGFLSGSLDAGHSVYVNRIGPGQYEITLCDAPWEYSGSTYYFNARLTAPL